MVFRRKEGVAQRMGKSSLGNRDSMFLLGGGVTRWGGGWGLFQ